MSVQNLDDDDVIFNIILATNTKLFGEQPDPLKAKELYRRYFLAVPNSIFEKDKIWQMSNDALHFLCYR